MNNIRAVKVGRHDYMGFAWFKIYQDGTLLYKVKATDLTHALAMHKQLS